MKLNDNNNETTEQEGSVKSASESGLISEPTCNAASVDNVKVAENYVKLFNEEGLEVADEYLADTYEELPQEVCDMIAKLLEENKPLNS